MTQPPSSLLPSSPSLLPSPLILSRLSPSPITLLPSRTTTVYQRAHWDKALYGRHPRTHRPSQTSVTRHQSTHPVHHSYKKPAANLITTPPINPTHRIPIASIHPHTHTHIRPEFRDSRCTPAWPIRSSAWRWCPAWVAKFTCTRRPRTRLRTAMMSLAPAPSLVCGPPAASVVACPVSLLLDHSR